MLLLSVVRDYAVLDKFIVSSLKLSSSGIKAYGRDE